MDTAAASLNSDLKLIQADAAKMAVTTGSIVKGFDVVSDVRVRKIAVLVDMFLDPLLLQASEERFGDWCPDPSESTCFSDDGVGPPLERHPERARDGSSDSSTSR